MRVCTAIMMIIDCSDAKVQRHCLFMWSDLDPMQTNGLASGQSVTHNQECCNGKTLNVQMMARSIPTMICICLDSISPACCSYRNDQSVSCESRPPTISSASCEHVGKASPYAVVRHPKSALFKFHNILIHGLACRACWFAIVPSRRWTSDRAQ